jgi:hypothetical protein
MSLSVEVAGYGICQTSLPFSVLVICVQQEQFQAWTVYRRGSSFDALAEQLRTLHPNLPQVPRFNLDDLTPDNLELCRLALNDWLQSITANPMILRTQSMYQFLCVDANMPPPYLEIYWKNGNNGSFEEMEMDDMFEKHLDENEMDGDADSSIEGEWEQDEQAAGGGQTVFGFDQSGAKVKKGSHKGHGAKRSNTDAMVDDDDEKDGLDIQSLSVVEAEFLYDRETEGKHPEDPASKKKKTINLDAFHIIKVIGKGQ